MNAFLKTAKNWSSMFGMSMLFLPISIPLWIVVICEEAREQKFKACYENKDRSECHEEKCFHECSHRSHKRWLAEELVKAEQGDEEAQLKLEWYYAYM